MGHTYNKSCDICRDNGWIADHTVNNPPYCAECDSAPCKAVEPVVYPAGYKAEAYMGAVAVEPAPTREQLQSAFVDRWIEDFSPTGAAYADERRDADRERRDQLILGASRFMDSGQTFTRVDRSPEFPEGWKPRREEPTEKITGRSRSFYVDLGPDFRAFDRAGPAGKWIDPEALSAEGAGDTVIPAGTPLDDAVRATQGNDVGGVDPAKTRPWWGRFSLGEPMTFTMDPEPESTPPGGTPRFFDGSIPPGISTDPFKSPVDAMPNTAIQNLRQATIDAIAAHLKIVEALDKWEAYQTCALSSKT